MNHKQRKPKAPKASETAPPKPDEEVKVDEPKLADTQPAGKKEKKEKKDKKEKTDKKDEVEGASQLKAAAKKAATKKSAAKKAAAKKPAAEKADKADAAKVKSNDEESDPDSENESATKKADDKKEDVQADEKAEVAAPVEAATETPAEKAEAAPAKELSKKRQAYSDTGMSFAVARVRQEMNKNGINAFVNAQITEAKAGNDLVRAKNLSNTKTRFSEKAFVVAAMTLEKLITPLVEHGFTKTQESGHKTLNLDYLYAPGFETNSFHNLLLRVKVYRDHAQEAFSNLVLAETSKSYNQAKKDIGKSHILKKRAAKKTEGGEAAETEKEEGDEAEEEENATGSAAEPEKKHFEHYIAQFCKSISQQRGAALHTSRQVLKHLSEIVRGVNYILTRVSYELTLVPGNKTINENIVLAALKVCLLDCSPVSETFESGESDISRIIVDSSFAETVVSDIRVSLNKYSAALPEKEKKAKKEKKEEKDNTEEQSEVAPAESKSDAEVAKTETAPSELETIAAVAPPAAGTTAELVQEHAAAAVGYRDQDPAHFVESDQHIPA